MSNDETQRGYPLPSPDNIAYDDAKRIRDAISLISDDIGQIAVDVTEIGERDATEAQRGNVRLATAAEAAAGTAENRVGTIKRVKDMIVSAITALQTWVSEQLAELESDLDQSISEVDQAVSDLTQSTETALAGKASTTALSALPIGGQAVLQKVGSNVVLLPYKGNRIMVGGVSCTIPDAGVSLAPTGLAAGTDYYIYAQAAAGVVTSLTAETTGHSTSTSGSNKGTEIKTGDNSRSLVGYVRAVTGPAFEDSSTRRFVVSWFNQDAREMQGSASVSSTTSATYVELSANDRVQWIQFANKAATLVVSGSVSNNPGGFVSTAVWLNGAITGQTISTTHSDSAVRQSNGPSVVRRLAEGYHYASIAMAANTGGTVSFSGTSGSITATLH